MSEEKEKEKEKEVKESMEELARDDFDFVKGLISDTVDSMTEEELDEWLNPE